MILLLDSNVLVSWLDDRRPLAEPAGRSIADPANSVLVSAATVWELEIKRALGKVDFDADLARAIDDAGFSGIAITLQDATAAANLPPHHRDPFDRMLVAQAQRHDAVLVSRDRALASYEVKVMTA